MTIFDNSVDRAAVLMSLCERGLMNPSLVFAVQ